jgi:hypothetical protein
VEEGYWVEGFALGWLLVWSGRGWGMGGGEGAYEAEHFGGGGCCCCGIDWVGW